jgi:hypothetical protein
MARIEKFEDLVAWQTERRKDLGGLYGALNFAFRWFEICRYLAHRPFLVRSEGSVKLRKA